MPRLARIVIPDLPHHITQRGNNRAEVFFTNHDYRVYLRLLEEHAEKHGLEVHAYCLMKNHIHLVATPRLKNSLAVAVGRAHFRYTQYFNERYERNGHLWQGRFYSTAMDEGHFLQAIRYIERNPVHARYVQLAWEYPWSSAAAHVGLRKRDNLINLNQWEQLAPDLDWRAELCTPQELDSIKQLCSNTHTGRPLGSDSFIRKLEIELGCSLRPLTGGRPKNQQNLG